MFIHITSFKACINRRIKKMAAALKDNRVVYTSFKHGSFEGERNGRYFTDFTIGDLKISARDSGTADRGLLDYR